MVIEEAFMDVIRDLLYGAVWMEDGDGTRGEDLLTFMVLLFGEFMPLLYSQLSAGVQNKATPAYFFSPRESK